MWNTVQYARAGRRNLDRGLKCQDYIHYDECGSVQTITLADGTGDNDYARMGAAQSCKVLGQFLSENYEQIYNMDKYDIQFNVVVNINTELDLLCVRYGINIEQLQSTLLGLAIDHKSGTFIAVHLGDGQIEIGRKGIRRIISYPENGINKSKTWLTSMNRIGSHIRVIKGDIRDIEEFILSSDGWPDQNERKEYACRLERFEPDESGIEKEWKYADDVSFISLMLQ